jgi:hypothetical protein
VKNGLQVLPRGGIVCDRRKDGETLDHEAGAGCPEAVGTVDFTPRGIIRGDKRLDNVSRVI